MERVKSDYGSKPRNPPIDDTPYVRKVLESWGRSMILMVEECRKAGFTEPEYPIAVDEVKLVLRRKATG